MTKSIYFSKFVVTEQVFYRTKHSYALVNLKPLVPGHVLVVPLRKDVIGLSDLTFEESQDYFNTLQLIQNFIYWQYKADSLNIAIQDGPEAGQSVAHLHTHIIPRFKMNNIGDQIYEKLDHWNFEDWNKRREEYLNGGGRDGRRALAKPDDQRMARTEKQMFQEAIELNTQLSKYLQEFPEMKKWVTKETSI
ncbi:hypothetical protein Kpol_1005p3 [Vanderwaltozyma polyspora DSM 70294]|uniref:Bis(5'-adenosyl)-triphosphatase n=1 Tax=Vanderwaltozyma polyspora (strain ATCC 22028 / DSM 70294 / BCRC 21397 / CBS 2163 / NBRC 10782 / NRRL Y-8283 / UCD 57-17) TaxID=436907 RepID=A7TS30_VANPO|nr:uncharacterized protein Kpol_1005p3 [Vanderwaltozyma polyspora DSM 70294]EDO14916.1 hypothetical protein Kpol_1005p3 [Vanderwaltozyma polyspora DSM 70294]